MRASKESDDTQRAYRVAALQTFLSGRIQRSVTYQERNREWGIPMSMRLRSSTILGFLLSAFFLFSVISHSAQRSVSIVDHLFLVDSKGKILGNSPGNSTFPYGDPGPWLIEIDQRLFAIWVSPSGFGVGGFLYELPACQGTAWIYVNNPPPAWATPNVIASPGHTLYMARDTIAPRSITVRSSSSGDDCLEQGGGSVLAKPAEPVIDLDTVFTPPFSVRVVPLRGNGFLAPGR